MTRTLRLGFVLGCLSAAGCQHEPQAGRASFAFVKPPPPPLHAGPVQAEKGKTRLTFKDAEPVGKLADPVYPAGVPASRAGLVLIGVRISVDADGNVTDVSPSMTSLSTPSPYYAQFKAAVEAAVSQWKFHPAELLELERVDVPANQGGGSYWRLARRDKTETYFDLQFTFDASGRVSGSRSSAPAR